jgi:AcrR family transcriptional regulator
VTPLLPGELERPAALPPRPPRRAAIIDAARHVLEREGPAALTMRRLGEELGIQAPSLYKHFPGKSAVERELIIDAFLEIGEVGHGAIHEPGPGGRLLSLLTAYRRHSLSHANLYRLATGGPLDRSRLPPGLEDWAGNPWFVVTGDPVLAQALWSFAHGMVILELDDRYPPGSDLDRTWRAGAAAFERSVATPSPGPPAVQPVRQVCEGLAPSPSSSNMTSST